MEEVVQEKEDKPILENNNVEEKEEGKVTESHPDASTVLETVSSEEKKEPEEKETHVSRENPVLGRKVFFLNPPLSIVSFVMENLKEEQYEVYIINDYKVAKPVLRLYPDSICFIFIDDVLPLKGWYKFIQSCNEDDSLKTIFLGAISGRIRPKDKENFLMNLKLPCGFISLGGAVNEVFQNIKGILKINGAKGSRQYVQLNCDKDNFVSGYLADGFRLYEFKITNMSTAGIAIAMEKSKGYIFKKNIILGNICINLHRKTVVCSGLVYEVKQIGLYYVVIILFTKQTTAVERTAIRNYVFETKQKQIDIVMNNVLFDDTNYARDDVPSENIEVDNEKTNTENKETNENVQQAEEKQTLDSPEKNEILSSIPDLDEKDAVTEDKDSVKESE